MYCATLETISCSNYKLWFFLGWAHSCPNWPDEERFCLLWHRDNGELPPNSDASSHPPLARTHPQLHWVWQGLSPSCRWAHVFLCVSHHLWTSGLSRARSPWRQEKQENKLNWTANFKAWLTSHLLISYKKLQPKCRTDVYYSNTRTGSRSQHCSLASKATTYCASISYMHWFKSLLMCLGSSNKWPKCLDPVVTWENQKTLLLWTSPGLAAAASSGEWRLISLMLPLE